MANFKHITREQAAIAQQAFDAFFKTLSDNGLRLNYDYDGGSFYVADECLVGAYLSDADDGSVLSSSEMDEVIKEGFINPGDSFPWFSAASEPLKVREGGHGTSAYAWFSATRIPTKVCEGGHGTSAYERIDLTI